MAIHFSSIPNPRPRQSGPMVLSRPLQTRFPPVNARRPCRDSYCLWGRSGNCASACYTLTAGWFHGQRVT